MDKELNVDKLQQAVATDVLVDNNEVVTGGPGLNEASKGNYEPMLSIKASNPFALELVLGLCNKYKLYFNDNDTVISLTELFKEMIEWRTKESEKIKVEMEKNKIEEENVPTTDGGKDND